MTSTPKSLFYRIDNTTWSYSHFLPLQEGTDNIDDVTVVYPKEIRINIENVPNSISVYTLANTVRAIFDRYRKKITRKALQDGIEVQISRKNVNHLQYGTWLIKAKKIQITWNEYVQQSFAFFNIITPKHIVKVDVSKVSENSWQKVMSLFPMYTTDALSIRTNKLFSQPLTSFYESKYQKSIKESFKDTFTYLAQICLTTVEPLFVMQAKHKGSWYFCLNKEKEELLLKRYTVPPTAKENDQFLENNKAVVNFYKNFLIEEYGSWFIDFIAANYAIDFDSMIKSGMPLYPDHVSKCNIGVLNLEIQHIEVLAQKLISLKNIVDQEMDSIKGMHFADCINALMLKSIQPAPLSIREMRGILRQVKKYVLLQKGQEQAVALSSSDDIVTVQYFKYFLDTLVTTISKTDIRDSTIADFNTLVSLIMPSDVELESAYTGRKIRHLSIMGFHTMGNKDTSNVCRDMFELLHTFDSLKKTEDWNNFKELLGHVVAKKSLYRTMYVQGSNGRDIQWNVGLLIPGPTSRLGEERWYYNKEFVDDGYGNVNYTLMPACNKYTDANGKHLAPMIKLYRSTASNKNAINWQDSLQADLNPSGSPGSLNPDVSYIYERKSFDERTIPLWVAYALGALKLIEDLSNLRGDTTISLLTQSTIDDYVTKSIEALAIYFDKYQPQDKEKYLPQILQAKLTRDYTALKELLGKLSEQYKEHPSDKKAQNIVFVGHSLGGALAQFGMYYFGTRVDRIPLPGCNFECYSSDAPAIDNDKDKAFMDFGRQNKNLFRVLQQRWKIYHQFEYGDFVPQAGGSHLGTTSYNTSLDSDWLDIEAKIFRPLSSAEHTEIVTAPTHGRRIGMASQGTDYMINSLTPSEIAQFDHAYWLKGRLANLFGYTLFRSPRITEAMRLYGAKLLYPLNRIIDRIVGNTIGKRDDNGVFYSIYGKN